MTPPARIWARRAAAAQVDAIDGTRCSFAGRHFSIQRPAITTPGGASLIGDCTRRAFAHAAPPGEDGAGAAVIMRLMSEDEVRVAVAAAVPVVWHRCKAETT